MQFLGEQLKAGKPQPFSGIGSVRLLDNVEVELLRHNPPPMSKQCFYKLSDNALALLGMADAKTLEELAQPEYWNARYQNRENGPTFEWFKSFRSLEPFFSAHLPKPEKNGVAPRILHLGCGNSRLPIDLHILGYRNQMCVDFSAVVIGDMVAQYAEKEGIEWKAADVRKMEDIKDGDFEVAIDKGTLDSMISGSLWDPPDHVKRNTRSYIDEVVRVLKPGGVFVYITYRQPHFVKPMLEREGTWDLAIVELKEEDGTFEYFGFVIKKPLSCQ